MNVDIDVLGHDLDEKIPALRMLPRVVIPTEKGDLILEGRLKYQVLELIDKYLDEEYELLRLDEMYKDGWSP